MVYFGHYDKDGTYVGFFTTELHGTNIPTPTIELNEKQWHEALSGDFKVIGGEHTYSQHIRNDEVALNGIRIIRNLLLTECDWTQMPDNPLSYSVKQEWRTYRQELRDMMSNCDIDNIRYPIKPKFY